MDDEIQQLWPFRRFAAAADWDNPRSCACLRTASCPNSQQPRTGNSPANWEKTAHRRTGRLPPSLSPSRVFGDAADWDNPRSAAALFTDRELSQLAAATHPQGRPRTGRRPHSFALGDCPRVCVRPASSGVLRIGTIRAPPKRPEDWEKTALCVPGSLPRACCEKIAEKIAACPGFLFQSLPWVRGLRARDHDGPVRRTIPACATWWKANGDGHHRCPWNQPGSGFVAGTSAVTCRIVTNLG